MIVPVIVTFAGQTVQPSAHDLDTWQRMHLDAGSQFERMLGTRADIAVGPPAVVRSREVLIDRGEVNTSATTFAQVDRALRLDAGVSPDVVVYSVCAWGTGGGGRGAARPWRGWYKPSTGGLAVLGERHLRSAALAAKPGLLPQNRWTPSRRRAYFTNIALLVHELGHAAGALPHFGGDPYAPAYARRTIMNYGSYSGDAWWLGKLMPDGMYAGMVTNGLESGPPSEHDSCRASVHLNRGASGEQLRLDPGERNDVLAGALPAYQGLGHGRSVWEWVL